MLFRVVCIRMANVYRLARLASRVYSFIFIMCVVCELCVRIRSDDVTSLIIFNIRPMNVSSQPLHEHRRLEIPI